MLTIRWHHGDGGESVIQGDSVRYTDKQTLMVWKDGPTIPKMDGELTTGCAYVMNDRGATVAIYHMGGSVPPVKNVRPQSRKS